MYEIWVTNKGNFTELYQVVENVQQAEDLLHELRSDSYFQEAWCIKQEAWRIKKEQSND